MNAPAWGAIFDWDGVIIDSSRHHEESWERLAREAARDPAGGCPVAGVEGRLAAADLAARELDFESGLVE